MEKISLNEKVKVKLTPHGVDIYYHQNDDFIKEFKSKHPNADSFLKSRMPQIDKNGFTEFTLWQLMELYGEHIGMTKPNVFEDNNIYFTEDEL